jgi:hypothetical protein
MKNKKWLAAVFLISVLTFGMYKLMPLVDYTIGFYWADPINCSVDRLVDSPWKFHNRKIRIVGVVRILENSAIIYGSQEKYKYSLYEGIAVPINYSTFSKQFSNGEYVIVEGTFDSMSHGQKDLWIGTLYSVTRIEKRNENFPAMVYDRP